MAFGKFQDFLTGLVKGQRGFFFSAAEKLSMDDLLDKLMGTNGEISAIVTARELLDQYRLLDEESKLNFFNKLEQDFNAVEADVRLAFDKYDRNPSSANLNRLSRASEPLRHELLRRLNQTPGATHDLVSMREDLLSYLKKEPQLLSVDEDFVRLFSSWFGRGFLVLQTINWSTSAAILERIIRYEAVHAIQDWDDLRRRIDPLNRRCFAFFHPALTDEPLIFVEVALGHKVPATIESILQNPAAEEGEAAEDFTTATFYSISNCQPGLKNISFGNFLIKQVVQVLQAEFPSIKQFVTLSPIPGFNRWLDQEKEEEVLGLSMLKQEVRQIAPSPDLIDENSHLIKRLVFNYLTQVKRGKYPLDPVARFHLGNGAMVHQLHGAADLSEKGLKQSHGTMVNYLYDLRTLETNHEKYVKEGDIEIDDKLKSLIIKE